MTDCSRQTALAWLIRAPIAAQAPAFAQSNAKVALSYDNSGFLFGFQSGTGTLTMNDGGAAFGGGSGGTDLGNTSNNVVIKLKSKKSGLRLSLGLGYTTFRVGRMIKGPRMAPKAAAVEKAPPTRAKIAAAPPSIPKPRLYDLEFGFDKARLGGMTSEKLDQIIEQWKGKPVSLRIVGHTDTKGPKSYNLRLSRRRAEAVKRVLVGKGILESRISARGVGESDLWIKTTDNVRLRKNRRVSVSIHSPPDRNNPGEDGAVGRAAGRSANRRPATTSSDALDFAKPR